MINKLLNLIEQRYHYYYYYYYYYSNINQKSHLKESLIVNIKMVYLTHYDLHFNILFGSYFNYIIIIIIIIIILYNLLR
jgi:hypothetical protein